MENLIISENKKEKDVKFLFDIAECNVNRFLMVYKNALDYNVPANTLNDLSDSCEEFNRQIFLIINHIVNPSATSYVDSVREKEKQLSQKMNEINL